MKWYKIPTALTREEWQEWRTEIKSNHPIQYFFRETLSGIINSCLFRIDQNIWKLKHRFIRKHQYHILRLRSLNPYEYHDPDAQILAAAFDTLSIFAENHLMGDGISGTKFTKQDLDHYDGYEGEQQLVCDQINREKKIIDLRNWWVNERPKRETEDLYEQVDDFIYDPSDDSAREKAQEWITLVSKQEQDWLNEDLKKFKELVDLLPHLWN